MIHSKFCQLHGYTGRFYYPALLSFVWFHISGESSEYISALGAKFSARVAMFIACNETSNESLRSHDDGDADYHQFPILVLGNLFTVSAQHSTKHCFIIVDPYK